MELSVSTKNKKITLRLIGTKGGATDTIELWDSLLAKSIMKNLSKFVENKIMEGRLPEDFRSLFAQNGIFKVAYPEALALSMSLGSQNNCNFDETEGMTIHEKRNEIGDNNTNKNVE